MDLSMSFNRNAILYENGRIWTSLDEGGFSGGCISVLDGIEEEYVCLLNRNNLEVHTNTIFTHNTGVYTSSLAGLVSINRDAKKFVHFQLSPNPRERRLFDAFTVNGRIWGVRDDGFVNIDVENRKYTLYRLENESNVIYGLVEFRGNYYFSNENKLFKAENSQFSN